MSTRREKGGESIILLTLQLYSKRPSGRQKVGAMFRYGSFFNAGEWTSLIGKTRKRAVGRCKRDPPAPTLSNGDTTKAFWEAQ
jgi:hypothetical protein